MEALIFWIVGIGMTVSALAVVANRNPVACALCLAVTFIFLAVGFLSLQAYFLAMVQIIVYAGAVMVLFLFIIMLLDLRGSEARPLRWGRLLLLLVLALVPLAIFQRVAGEMNEGTEPLVWSEVTGEEALSVWNMGQILFQDYLLVFLSTSVLLLVATLGVVILSRRPLEGEEALREKEGA